MMATAATSQKWKKQKMWIPLAKPLRTLLKYFKALVNDIV
jgi:hypothetical protein